MEGQLQRLDLIALPRRDEARCPTTATSKPASCQLLMSSVAMKVACKLIRISLMGQVGWSFNTDCSDAYASTALTQPKRALVGDVFAPGSVDGDQTV